VGPGQGRGAAARGHLADRTARPGCRHAALPRSRRDHTPRHPDHDRPFHPHCLAAQLSPEDLARACHEAGVRYGTTPRQVDEVLAHRPNAPGTRQLRAVLHGDVKVTLSKLEQRFLTLLRDHGLPLPQTNRKAGTRRVDCRWPTRRLTVELDGYRYHHSRHAWEQDRRREREAHARGDEFRRYTYGDVLERPALMLAELRALLRASTEGALPDAPSVVAVPRTKL
jgi:very-short-patch-repair endonuclease